MPPASDRRWPRLFRGASFRPAGQRAGRGGTASRCCAWASASRQGRSGPLCHNPSKSSRRATILVQRKDSDVQRGITPGRGLQRRLFDAGAIYLVAARRRRWAVHLYRLFQQYPLVCRAIMRCKIKVFCVLAAVSSSWLHERHGPEALRASRRRRRLDKTCPPAGGAWSPYGDARQLGPFPKTLAPRRAAAGSARVRGCNSPAPLTHYLGCGSAALLVRKFVLHVPRHRLAQGQMVFQRRRVMQPGGASRPSGGFRRHRGHAAPHSLTTAASRREADKPASRGIRAARCAMLLQSGCAAGVA